MKMHPLEHRIAQKFKEYQVVRKRIGIAVSGGRDSMVMLHLAHKLSRLLGLEIVVLHVHHGFTVSSQITHEFRYKSWLYVYGYCHQNNIKFYSNLYFQDQYNYEILYDSPWLSRAKSENDFRQLRQEFFNYQRSNLQIDKILFAHHQQDLLETRLIRMIRGTGLSGLEAMSYMNGYKFRPLLDCERKDIDLYLLQNNIKFIEDPSNEESQYLRNWIRNEWLIDLEKKHPGGRKNLAYSLARITSEQEHVPSSSQEEVLTSKGLSREKFSQLNIESKKSILVNYFRQLNIPNYTNSLLLEIIKRLDSNQKRFSFRLSNSEWSIEQDYIRVRPRVEEVINKLENS